MGKNTNRARVLEFRQRKEKGDSPRMGTVPFLSPKKQLGQNFLTDPNIIRKIIEACQLKKKETILEIGAGGGQLTEKIAPDVQEVIAIETDERFCLKLQKRFSISNVRVVEADFLQFDLSNLTHNIKVIGNLPYYITSPIIAKIFEHKRHFSSLFFTVQLEVGQRMVALPNSKAYSAFSLLTQYHSQPKMLFKIKRTCFNPPPKVDSCFVQLTIPQKPIYMPQDERFLFDIIHRTFNQRRKTLTNTLSDLVRKEQLRSILSELNLPLTARPENLTLKDFVAISNLLTP